MSLSRFLKKNPGELKKMSDADMLREFESATVERNKSFRTFEQYRPYTPLLIGIVVGAAVSFILPNK